MSDLLSLGASGVRAYQTALTTVSENIANAGAAGYTRRSTELREVTAAGAGLTAGRVANGSGVAIGDTLRSADAFRSAAVRTAGADLARTETGAVWLERIQSALTGNDLAGRLTTFFNTARSVAADPAASAPRAVMLEAGVAVAAGFTATGAALAQVAADLDATADHAVAELNSLGQALAKVNGAIGRAGAGSAAAASLADQRDSILETMSTIVDVNATFDAAGRATVRVGGGAGPVLVAGAEAGSVTYVRNAEGATSFAVHRDGIVASLAPNGGVLAGVADANARVAEARTATASIATEFVAGANAAQVEGRTLDGIAGTPMFAADASSGEVSLVLSDPRGIAAAAVGEGTRGNGNIARFDALRTNGGFEQRITSLVAGNAAALGGRRTVAEAQSAIRDGAIAAREAVAGVDLDSEAVDLLRFQQAYQASSRVIQVAREMLQSILDIR